MLTRQFFSFMKGGLFSRETSNFNMGLHGDSPCWAQGLVAFQSVFLKDGKGRLFTKHHQ
jgi:hypothetical protein